MAKEFSLGSPFDVKLVGIVFNQDEFPWWVTSILTWIRMVQFVNQCHGKQARMYQSRMEAVMNKGNPHEVYSLYKQCTTYLDFVHAGGEDAQEKD